MNVDHAEDNMDSMRQPAYAGTGDWIEHDLVQGFVMRVNDVLPCGITPGRDEPHRQYQVMDVMGGDDWLCAYDVTLVQTAAGKVPGTRQEGS